jgi:penicillin-binding protein 2
MSWWRARRSNADGDPFEAVLTGRFGFKSVQRKYSLELNDGVMTDAFTTEKLGRNVNYFSLWISCALAILMILALLTKVYWLQVVRGDFYRNLSEGNRIRIKKISAERGLIYDRNQRPLVHNVANFLLYAIPADLPTDEAERAQLFAQITKLVPDWPLASFRQQLQGINKNSYESFQPLFITDNVPYEAALAIYLSADKMPGVFLSSTSRRQYDLPSWSFSHLLGYTGKINAEELAGAGTDYSMIDYLGKSGLEKFYENELRGVSGIKQIEVDAFGKEKKTVSESSVENGRSLLLSIDIPTQVRLELTMREYLAKGGFKRASAIAMDPNNGEVLALVSLPAYDNNVFAQGISSEEYQALINDEDKPLYSRAISGEFPSGSTIKPVMVAAGLDSGIVTDQTNFLSNGGLRIGQWFFPDWKAGGHGQTDARKAIAESVNTYFYYLGGGYQDFQGLGIERMMNYFKIFGLGKQTGIDLPGEENGFLPSKEWKEEKKNEMWYIGDTYHVAIGQGDLLVTPLQVAYYTTFFANGGQFYRPHLLKAMISPEGKQIEIPDNNLIGGSKIKSADVEVVREGMRQGVTAGGSIRLNSLPVEAAGKTGTAQWSSKKAPHAWFTGFAPYDKPEIVLTILVEEGEEGSRVAVPIAYDFMRWYFEGKKSDAAIIPKIEAPKVSSGTIEVSD